MRYFFLPLLFLFTALTNLRAEKLQITTGCDTLITNDGQMMFVTFLSKGPYEIQYYECDGYSTKVKTINRSKIREIKLRENFQYVAPSRGVPQGATRWYNYEERVYRKSLKILGMGGATAFSFLLMWLLAATTLLTFFPIYFMLIFFGFGMMLATLISGTKMLKQLKTLGPDFKPERNMVIAGMVLAGFILGLIFFSILFAIITLIAFGF